MIKRETLLTLPGFMKEYNLEVLISGDRKTRESNVEKHPQSQTKKKTPTSLLSHFWYMYILGWN